MFEGTEAGEQEALFRWAAMSEAKYPALRLLHHVPNGGLRSARSAARLKAQGVKPGVPDLCLPVARGGYHGLYIELKRAGGGRISDAQAWWIDTLTREGYWACVCEGWARAAGIIERYLSCKGESRDEN